MELLVSASGLDLSPQTIRTLSQRIDLAVDRLETVIETIVVQINGRNDEKFQSRSPRETLNTLSCLIQVALSGNETIEIEDADSNLAELIERITERLGVVISKRADDRKSATFANQKRYSHHHPQLLSKNRNNANLLR